MCNITLKYNLLFLLCNNFIVTLHSKVRPLKIAWLVLFTLFKIELSWEYESSSKSGGDNTQLVCSNWEALIKGEF